MIFWWISEWSIFEYHSNKPSATACKSAGLYLDPHAPKENKGHMRIQKVQRLYFMTTQKQRVICSSICSGIPAAAWVYCSCQALWQLLIMICTVFIVHDTTWYNMIQLCNTLYMGSPFHRWHDWENGPSSATWPFSRYLACQASLHAGFLFSWIRPLVESLGKLKLGSQQSKNCLWSSGATDLPNAHDMHLLPLSGSPCMTHVNNNL